MSPRATSSIDELTRTWGRWSIGWHTVFLGLVAAAAFPLVLDPSLSTDVKLWSTALLGVMVGLYLALGWRGLTDDTPGVRGAVYIVSVWACFLLVAALGPPQVYFLLFALMPQTWVYLTTRWAVTVTFVAVTALAVIQIGQNGWDRDAVVGTLPYSVLQIGVSLLLGLFITGVFGEAERRAELIDELEFTRAELAGTEHDRGVLAERQRLSHEIHDTLAQGFTSILTLSQAVDIALDHDVETARDRLHLLERTARDNLAEARALVGTLTPVDLAGTSLADAVRRVAGRFADEMSIPVEVDIVASAAVVPANSEVVILRAAQEALANVRKHAGAAHVRVALGPSPAGSVALTVADDGCGFDTAEHPGFGLRGMRSRVEQVGGALQIVSAPGAGTTVHVTVP